VAVGQRIEGAGIDGFDGLHRLSRIPQRRKFPASGVDFPPTGFVCACSEPQDAAAQAEA
jgi:hypothetical protein